MKSNHKKKHFEDVQKQFDTLKNSASTPEQQEQFIMDLACALERQDASPMLWSKIEHRIAQEKQRAERHAQKPFFRQIGFYLRAAVVLVVIVGGGLIWQRMNLEVPADRPILENAALAKVEKAERAYEAAIRELEGQAEPQFEAMDLELNFLYRDKLATIDAHISQCREALRQNPGNAHIRRYMLAALQDKKATLVEIVDLDI